MPCAPLSLAVLADTTHWLTRSSWIPEFGLPLTVLPVRVTRAQPVFTETPCRPQLSTVLPLIVRSWAPVAIPIPQSWAPTTVLPTTVHQPQSPLAFHR